MRRLPIKVGSPEKTSGSSMTFRRQFSRLPHWVVLQDDTLSLEALPPFLENLGEKV